MNLKSFSLTAVLVGLMASLLVVLGGSTAQAATYPYSPPSGFNDDLTANTYTQLSWNKVSAAAGYSIQYSTFSSMSSPKYRLAGKETQSQINGLKANTTYYARIRARSSSKDITDWSAKISFRTKDTAFGAPSTPTVSRDRRDSFKLDWSEVPNAASYRIQVVDTSASNATTYVYSVDNSAYLGRGGTVTLSDGSAPDDQLIRPGHTYELRVKALEAKADEDGALYDLTDYSGTRTFTTSSTWNSYPPTDFGVASVSVNKIVLTWQDVSTQPQPGQADHYRVQLWKGSDKRYIDTNKPGTWGTAVKSGSTWTLTLNKFCGNDPTLRCDSFTSGSSYYFRVSAQLGSTTSSDYTDSSGVKAVATSSNLATPDDLRVDSHTDRRVTLSWKDVAGADSYRLQQKLSSTSGTTRYLYDICDTAGVKFSCTRSGGRISVTLDAFADNGASPKSSAISASQTYYYRVAAQVGPDRTDGGQDRASDYTSSYLKVTTDGWPFAPPENLKYVESSNNTITMKWDPLVAKPGNTVPSRVVYRLQVAKNYEMTGTKTYPVSALNATAITITGLSQDAVYYFRIRAVDQATGGTLSDYIAKPTSGRTTDNRGSISGTLVSQDPAQCPVTDYKLKAYEGSGEAAGAAALNSAGKGQLDLLTVGSYALRYEYFGSGNCVSPWVDTDGSGENPRTENHMLDVYAEQWAVKATNTKTSPRVLPNQTTFAGVRMAGRIVNGSTNAGLAKARITAFGSPRDPGNTYREAQALSASGTNGVFEVVGLWPDMKYKMVWTSDAVGMSGSSSSYTRWYGPSEGDYITATNPGTNVKVTLCPSSGSCTVGYTQ